MFKSEANLGYVIMFRSLNDDASMYNELINNLVIEVPFSERAYVWIVGAFKGIGGWIIGIIGLIIFLAVAYLLGLVGVRTRKKKMLIILIVLIYLIIFKTTSLSTFLYSLPVLVPIVMGYFGIFFTASEDPDDYF